ncbi:conserved hypothetical protein [Actinacidiphila bryophytorum]|uniref:Uncharacterized protein n=1 Tax=Actinacidiphila bryophytorum TaxID=1436133 RepID=A0A9W4MIM0_9ACTN|nr:conserved hypothetical protein [Actinacidiphila bryophytorum]
MHASISKAGRTAARRPRGTAARRGDGRGPGRAGRPDRALPGLRPAPRAGARAAGLGPLLPVPAVGPGAAPPRAGDRAHHRAMRSRVRMGRPRRGLRTEGGPGRRADPLPGRRRPPGPLLDRPRRPCGDPRGGRPVRGARPDRRRMAGAGRRGRRGGRRRPAPAVRLVPRRLLCRARAAAPAGARNTRLQRLPGLGPERRTTRCSSGPRPRPTSPSSSGCGPSCSPTSAPTRAAGTSAGGGARAPGSSSGSPGARTGPAWSPEQVPAGGCWPPAWPGRPTTCPAPGGPTGGAATSTAWSPTAQRAEWATPAVSLTPSSHGWTPAASATSSCTRARRVHRCTPPRASPARAIRLWTWRWGTGDTARDHRPRLPARRPGRQPDRRPGRHGPERRRTPCGAGRSRHLARRVRLRAPGGAGGTALLHRDGGAARLRARHRRRAGRTGRAHRPGAVRPARGRPPFRRRGHRGRGRLRSGPDGAARGRPVANRPAAARVGDRPGGVPCRLGRPAAAARPRTGPGDAGRAGPRPGGAAAGVRPGGPARRLRPQRPVAGRTRGGPDVRPLDRRARGRGQRQQHRVPGRAPGGPPPVHPAGRHGRLPRGARHRGRHRRTGSERPVGPGGRRRGDRPRGRAGPLGRVLEVPPAPRRLARTLAALSESSEQAHYEDDPPPCDRTHRTPRGPPCGRTALLPKHGLTVVFFAGQRRRPLAGPPHQRAQCLVGAAAELREAVGGVRLLLDDARVEEFGEALAQDAGGHAVAALLEGAEAEGVLAQLPDDAQVPPAAEEVERGHHRAAGARPADRGSRFRRWHRVTSALCPRGVPGTVPS